MPEKDSPHMPTTPAQPQLYILTGASRGLGRAMQAQLLAAGHTVLALSRRPDAQPPADAAGRLTQWAVDLAHAAPVAERLGQWLRAQKSLAGWASATLINNAGVIPTIAPLHQVPTAEISQALRVGLEAPMLLTATFLAATADWPAQRRVLNISSGLGRRPMASQESYCAAKAGLDLFTRSLALSEAGQPNGARVCALAPGVVDTDMQVHLRSASAQHFPDLARFARLHSDGALTSPAEAARQILHYLARPDFGQEPLADVRTA